MKNDLIGQSILAWDHKHRRNNGWENWGIIKRINGDNYVVYKKSNPKGYQWREELIQDVHKWLDEGCLRVKEPIPKKHEKSEITIFDN
jgi:hypothetical protein